MTDIQVAWLIAIAGGAGVAALYFATLWWTVKQAARSSRPLLFVGVSFLFRGILAAALLVAAAGGDPGRLLAAVGAFLVVRTVVVRRVRAGAPPASPHRASPREA